MHVFERPKPSPLSKEHTAVHYVETTPTSRDAYSPPLTSSLHSRNSATSAQESAYLRQASVLKWARLCFAVFITGVSIAVVAITSHLLHQYNSTVMPGDFNLVLWPLDTDVRPSLAILVPAALIAAGSLLYLGFACLPSPRSRLLTQNYFFTAVCVAGAVVSLIAIIFTVYTEHNVDASTNETIASWTCKMYDGARTFVTDSEMLQISVAMDPVLPLGFDLMCVETQVARWMMIGLFIVLFFGVGVAAIGLSIEKRIARVRRSRFHEKSSFP